jgi:[amino group carrier protein]-lysine/ornithine hydrolase
MGIELLEGLLAIYSTSHAEGPAVDYLVGAMRKLGYDHAGADAAGNAVGSRGDGPNEVLLLGHIDTVAGFIPVRREGDLLYGRGAVDAKGPLACFVEAGAAFQPPPGWRITVIGAVGEEAESYGALYVRQHYSPQALIIGEPSQWDRITLGFKGSLWVDYRVQCRVTHTASGHASASEAAIEFWNGVKAWCLSVFDETRPAFYRLTPSLRSMRSDSDGFLDNASLRINFRLPPVLTLEEITAGLHELSGDGELQYGEFIPAFKAEKNTLLVRAFLAAVRQAGGSPVFSLKTGTSDMNLVAPGWGCPAVAYGPGESSLDHTPNEHLSISEYHKSVEILTNVLSSLTTQ